jgi:hypothetical protein
MDPRQFIPGYFSFDKDPYEKEIVPSYDIPSLPASFTITLPAVPIPPVPTLPAVPTPSVLLLLLKPYSVPKPKLPKLPAIPATPKVTVKTGG